MIIGLICIVIGIIIILFYGDFKKIPNVVKTEGYAVKDNELKSTYSSIKYLVNGKEYYVQTKYKKRYKTGKKFTIKYNSKEPSQAIVLHNFKDYIIPLIVIILGIILVLLAVLKNKNTDNNQCCVCLDCPTCDVCCDCKNPYLNK